MLLYQRKSDGESNPKLVILLLASCVLLAFVSHVQAQRRIGSR